MQGFVISDDKHRRTKVRNPNYEYVRKLRGNQPKSQYQYLTLRQNGYLNEFLKFYPEYSYKFIKYREQVHEFTNTLHSYYHRCYCKKEQKLGLYDKEYRAHMFNLHQIYIADNRKYISKYAVVNYVNKLVPAHLMYAINFKHRSVSPKVGPKEE